MGEGLVGLGHPVEVVLALEGAALLVERVENLSCELLVHVLLAPLAREPDKPADGERPRAPLRYLDRHLVVRAADAAGAHLEHRRDRLDRLLEHLDGRLAAPLADAVERVVDDLLGRRALPVQHQLVDDLADEARSVHGIGLRRPDLDFCAARHQLPRLAPYLERPWRRSETPAASRAARMTL